MSRRHRSTAMAATAVPSARSPSLRLLIAGLLCIALGGVATTLLASRVTAEPPDGVTYYSAEEAAAAGVAIDLNEAVVGDETVLEIDATDDERLLAVAADAGLVAVSEGFDVHSGSLAIRQPDGAVLLAELDGVLDAAFAPDASWLAVLDGHGSLLRLDPASGAAELIAGGPFTGPIAFAGDGSLLLRAVSSIAAPIISELVRLDMASGEFATLSGDELVYAAFELDDGAIVYAAHARGEGTVVMRAEPQGARRIADLGAGAGQVDVSGDGAIAFAISGDVYLLDAGASSPRRLGSGARPRFSPDGEELLVAEAGATVVLGRDGSVLARLVRPAAEWGCRQGCDR